MPRRRKEPRLYLDPFRRTWMIRDVQKIVRTGFGEQEIESAELALSNYLMDQVKACFVADAPVNDGEKIYFIRDRNRVKIGRTTNVALRFKALQAASPVKLELLWAQPGRSKSECAYHKRFSKYRVHGEWFQIKGELKKFLVRYGAFPIDTVPFAFQSDAVKSEPEQTRTEKSFVDKELVVGVAGFEPATPSSRTRCATRLRYTPTIRAWSGKVDTGFPKRSRSSKNQWPRLYNPSRGAASARIRSLPSAPSGKCLCDGLNFRRGRVSGKKITHRQSARRCATPMSVTREVVHDSPACHAHLAGRLRFGRRGDARARRGRPGRLSDRDGLWARLRRHQWAGGGAPLRGQGPPGVQSTHRTRDRSCGGAGAGALRCRRRTARHRTVAWAAHAGPAQGGRMPGRRACHRRARQHRRTRTEPYGGARDPHGIRPAGGRAVRQSLRPCFTDRGRACGGRSERTDRSRLSTAAPHRSASNSTIVACLGEPTLLRPGGVPRAAIERALGKTLASAPALAADDETPLAPGMLASHYAPRTPMRLHAGRLEPGEALLAFGASLPEGAARSKKTLNLSARGDLIEAAANLFSHLRALDAAGASAIAVMPIPHEGLGEAINDRLARAAADR